VSAATRRAAAGLMRAAARAVEAPYGSVERADARTSACDYRAALSLARGVPIEHVDPSSGVGSSREIMSAKTGQDAADCEMMSA
jgi:hypothetical protein